MINIVSLKLLSCQFSAPISSGPVNARKNPDSGSSYAGYNGSCQLVKQVVRPVSFDGLNVLPLQHAR